MPLPRPHTFTPQETLINLAENVQGGLKLSLLEIKLIGWLVGNISISKGKLDIPSELKVKKFTHKTIKAFIKGFDSAWGKKLTREHLLELWCLLGDLSEDGEASDSDSSGD